MSPSLPNLALRAGNRLQIWDIEKGVIVNDFDFPEDVLYMKWVADDTLALVTANSVFHWRTTGSDKPQKIFDRHGELAGRRVTNYRLSPDQQWAVLVSRGVEWTDSRLQLYSVDRAVSQSLAGAAAVFAEMHLPGSTQPTLLFTFADCSKKLFVIPVPQGNHSHFSRKSIELSLGPEAAADSPLALEIGARSRLLYVVTQLGYVHLHDLVDMTLLARVCVSTRELLCSVPHAASDGILCLTATGQVLEVAADLNGVVGHVANNLQDAPLAATMASRLNLSGADRLVASVFKQHLASGDIKAAAQVALDSPGGALRTQETIDLLKGLPATPVPPLLVYFSTLLMAGRLNAVESLELARTTLAQNRPDLVEKWVTDDKLECGEALGDLARPVSAKLALMIYHRAGNPAKMAECFLEAGRMDQLWAAVKQLPLAEQPPLTPLLLRMIEENNGTAALKLALQLVIEEAGLQLVHVEEVVHAFLDRNMLREATNLALDYLKDNKPEHGALQTKILTANIRSVPQVADAILANGLFSHFDRQIIAGHCERVGLTQRALELYEDLPDLRRVLAHAHDLNPEWLVDFFRKIPPNNRLDCLREMLVANLQQNLPLVIRICARYSEQLRPLDVVEMLESFQATQAVLAYLQSIPSAMDNQALTHKYLEAAVQRNQSAAINQVVRESNFYEPGHVRRLLEEAKLPDALAYIVLCDRFDFIEEMTNHLYQRNMNRYLDVYTRQINPANTPAVVAALLDAACPEDYIGKLLEGVGAQCPAAALVEQAEKRYRLQAIRPWLEARAREGSQDSAVQGALAKLQA